MSKESKEPMKADISLAMGEALEGARRATGNASPIAPPDPEVAATAHRRQFTSAERTRILSAADAPPARIGAGWAVGLRVLSMPGVSWQAQP